ncbi:hypothetical protein D3C81_2342840 [compost metagenome]
MNTPHRNPGSLLVRLPISRVMLIPPLASRIYKVPAPSLAKLKFFTDCCRSRLL